MKRWIDGVVDNIYENILKVRAIQPNNIIFYEWFEDDSTYIQPKEDTPLREVKVNVEDTSPTECYSPNGTDISARVDTSPLSNRNLDDIQIP